MMRIPSFGARESQLAVNADLPVFATTATLVLAAVSLIVLIGIELRRRSRGSTTVAITGTFAVLALVIAVLRPVRITARHSSIGPKVLVLADTSRSMNLPSDESARGASTATSTQRRDVRERVLEQLRSQNAHDARFEVFGFGEGPAKRRASVTQAPEPHTPLRSDGESTASDTDIGNRSDLSTALASIHESSEEHPQAIIVVSDGRLDSPDETASSEQLAALGARLRAPIHTIATTSRAPDDASIRQISFAGSAVAHVPFPLKIVVGCTGSVACDSVSVTARELREEGGSVELATGTAHPVDGTATLDLSVTLDRAGARIVEIAMQTPAGDSLPDNNRRWLVVNVARERIRLLHVAGRPTSDVRALRRWLKRDASVDVVAFFILRSRTSASNASVDDLALIPFPVDELFTDHLPSFDAVVLHDFDAHSNGLEKHLRNLSRYVRAGGGLIMVGGPHAFASGGYASSPLADVLPISFESARETPESDTAPFVPAWTPQGRLAPLVAPLRAIVGDQLPVMPGANVIGDVKPGNLALWSHPTRRTSSGAAMPVLALGDQGNGRAIALAVDGTWRLEFSELGAQTSARGFSALWDGLLGWLMRDPRFEPASLELTRPCSARVPNGIKVHSTNAIQGSTSGRQTLEIEALGDQTSSKRVLRFELPPEPHNSPPSVTIALPGLEPGGYAARLVSSAGTTTRLHFACELGGDEWADPRPDVARLRRLAEATGGTFHLASDASLAPPLPEPTVVSTERHVAPIAPPWLWTTVATLLLGVHWVTRRRAGLA